MRHSRYGVRFLLITALALALAGCDLPWSGASHVPTAAASGTPLPVPSATPTTGLPGADHATITHSADVPGGIFTLAVGADGVAWASSVHTILRASPSLQMRTFAVSGYPQRLIVGTDGQPWFVANTSGGYAIGRITSGGSVRTFAVPAGYEVSAANVIIGPDGNLWYIATTPIFMTSTGGSFSTAFGRVTPTGSVHQFAYPRSTTGPVINTNDLAVGPDGNLWYALNKETFSQPDQNHVIHEGYAGGYIGRLTTSGQFKEFTIPNPQDGVGSIVAGPTGNIWYTGHGAVYQITPAGAVQSFPLPHGFQSPTIGPDGNLWFFEGPTNLGIGRLSSTGQLAEFPLNGHPGPSGLLPSAVGDPNSIVVGADGNLWFTERPWNVIGRITPTGQLTEYWPPTAGGRTISVLGQLAASPDGSIWYTINTYPPNSNIPQSGTIGRIVP